MADNEVSMMMSVYPGAMTGFAALNSGLVSINNVFMQTMARIDDNFGIIDSSIVATGAVVAQFAADSMSAFGEFEQGMKIVQMVSGQTAQDISYLSQKANEFSVSYRTDIDQITEGLQTLGRAGLNSASEQTEVLQNGLNTAKLEGRDLNSVLEELIQNTALLGGNLKQATFGEDSQYVNDLLVATSMSAPITTHDVSETLKYSGGIAAAAGANIRDEEGNSNTEGKAILEDYMAAIAAFAQKGVTGSIAGTALRAFFNKPATQDSSVTEALASINLKPEYLWEDDEETMKPVSEQIAIIKNQMDDLNISTMDQLQIWSKIVGGKMGQQMMKLDSKDIKELKKDIQAADGATSLAQKSMQTYQANLKEIGESGARLQRSVGGNLVAIANPFLEIIAKIVEFGNTDIMSVPITGGIIMFLTMVAKRIKAIATQLWAEISKVTQALRAGAGMITARQLKGEKGERSPLLGERYTESDLKKDITPNQLLKGFRQQFQNEVNKSLIGLSKKNAAIVEASKGWSAQSKTLSSMNKQWVSDDGKSFMQPRDNAIIAQLARHNLLNSEIQRAFFSGTKKEEIMSTPLSSGLTVREEIELLFTELQAKLQKTASVLNETSVATEKAAQAESVLSKTRNRTSLQKGYEVGLKKPGEDIIRKSSSVQAQKEANQKASAQREINIEKEKQAVVSTTVETGAQNVVNSIRTAVAQANEISNRMAPKTPPVGSSFILNPNIKTPLTKEDILPSKSSFGMRVFPNIPQNVLDEGKIFGVKLGEKLGKPLTYGQNLSLVFGKQYGNIEDAMLKGYTPLTRRPWFMQYNTPYDLFKNGPMSFSYVSDKEARMARGALSNAMPIGFGSGLSNYGLNSLSYSEINRLVNKSVLENSLKRGQDLHTGIPTTKSSLDANSVGQARLSALMKMNSSEQKSAAAILAETSALEKLILARQAEIDLLMSQSNKFSNKKDIWGTGLTKEQEKQLKEIHNRPSTTQNVIENTKMNQKLRPRDLSENVHSSKGGESFTAGPERFPKKEGFVNMNRGGALPGTYNPSQVQDALNSIKKQTTQSGPGISAMARLNSQQISQTNELIHSERTLSERIQSLVYKLGLGPKLSTTKDGSGMLGSLKGTLKDRWNQDRSGRFLNFGTGRVGSKVNGALNMLDAVGGVYMAAMMGFSAVINYVKGLYEEYAQELKNAKDAVKESYSERQQVENQMKQLYNEQNPEAEKDEADDYVLEQYGKMYDSLKDNNADFRKWIEATSHTTGVPKQYEMDEEADDGSMKQVEEEEKSDEEALQAAINENSYALYEATAQLQLATNKLVTKMQDGMWGIDGQSSALSDELGRAQDTWLGLTEGSGSIESGFLKTASQKDENYAGDTELTGLLLEDFKDAKGEWQKGLKTIFGKDFKNITSTMNSQATGAMRSMAQFSNSLGAGKNARLQSSMMNDRKSWQKLAKEMAKYEKKTGKHAMTQNTTNKRMENLIKKLQIDTHLSRAQVIAAAQLQQLQDMYQVAEQTFVPLMSDQAATAAQLYDTTAGGVYPSTGEAAGGAVSTAANSAAIAAYLSVMAQNAAVEAAYNQDLMDGKTQAKSKEEYLQEAAGTRIGLDGQWGQQVADFLGVPSEYYFGGDVEKQKKIAHALEYQGDRIRNPTWTDQQTSDYSKRIDALIDQGMSFSDAMELARKNYAGAVAPMVEAAYLSSNAGENEPSSGGGGGDGGGGGSGDKDNTGTKKERVDLVLCNKKEIPKLNVNLFKKPPTFTVLNKNFKLRDVKINTEDKPKAIMSSIKNAFIDVQKRTDPKIIQDEEAEYDPAGATDGNALPSGSSKPTTN